MSCCENCAQGYDCGATMGDFSMPRVYTQISDIDALKQRLDPEFRATDSSIAACTKLTEAEHKAWSDFYTAWRAYADKSTRSQVFCFDAFGLQCIGGGTVYEDGLEREKRLHEWQQKVQARCALDAPPIDDPRQRTAVETGWIPWVAGAIAVIGIVYTVSPVVRSLARR